MSGGFTDTTSLALNGLKFFWLSEIPRSFRDFPLASAVTSLLKNQVSLPHGELWIQRWIVTRDLSGILKIMLFSRLFYVTKMSGVFTRF